MAIREALAAPAIGWRRETDLCLRGLLFHPKLMTYARQKLVIFRQRLRRYRNAFITQLIAGCVLFFTPRLIGPVTALANQSWSGPSIAEKRQPILRYIKNAKNRRPNVLSAERGVNDLGTSSLDDNGGYYIGN